MTARIELLQQWVFSQLGLIEANAALTLDNIQNQWSMVSGDASFRRYFRVSLELQSYIVMDAPPEQEELGPFIDIAERLRTAGLRAPFVYASDIPRGMLLLEDFGDDMLKGALDNADGDKELGQRLFEQLLPVLRGMAYDCSFDGLADYSAGTLADELQLFPTWYVDRHCDLSFSANERRLWDDLCQQLLASALNQPQVFVHRDFHSCNLHYIKRDQHGVDYSATDGPAIGIIDFQDALHGPVSYDLASWLWDRYVTWPRGEVERWMLQARNVLCPSASDLEWIKTCDWMGLQRNLKIIGIFARLHYRDNKDGYLAMIPQFSDYVRDVLKRYPEFHEHAAVLDRFWGQTDAGE